MTIKISKPTEFQDIIEAANQFIDMSQIKIEVWNITPQELAESMIETGECEKGTYGINGVYYQESKSILLAYEGVKSYAQRRFTLAHEIGHAIHNTIDPDSRNWTKEDREATADVLGMMLEEIANNK